MKQRVFSALSFWVVFIACIAFSSCSVDDAEDSDYSKWSLSGNILDSSNNKGLPGATITYQDADGKVCSVTTSDDGSFYIDGLPYGSRTFTINYRTVNKKDTLYYTPKILNIGTASESSHMEGVLSENSVIIRLSPLNASVSGEFYLLDDISGKKVPAQKADLTVLYNDTDYVNLSPKTFSAKTDSLGKFTLKQLPADSGLSLQIAPVAYNGLRYVLANTELPRLKADTKTEIGRIYLVRDTLIEKPSAVKTSNVIDENFNGYKNVSPLATPYYVFSEKISATNLSVTVKTDTSTIYVDPVVKNDTLFLEHDIAFPAEAKIVVSIVAYGKKTENRYNLAFSGDSAFTTNRGLYAITSNAWPSNRNYKSSFGINDTIWVKFSEKLSSNVDRIQWNFAKNATRTIYCHNYGKNADAWIKKDTLFVKMMESILDSRVQGDSVGMNITAYAESGLILENFTLLTELDVPPASSSSLVTSSSSAEATSSSTTSNDDSND